MNQIEVPLKRTQVRILRQEPPSWRFFYASVSGVPQFSSSHARSLSVQRLIIASSALIITSLFGGCSTTSKHTLNDLLNHPARKPEYWAQFDRTRPLVEKVYPAPPELVDMLSMDNELNGFPEHPSSATTDPALVQDIKSALLELPEALRNRIGRRFLGLFLVHQLGGTAFTDIALNPDRTPYGIFMMIDVDAVTRKANDWMSWKESSPFKPEPGYSLKGEIESPENDTRRGAIQYILLHELGHIYSVDTLAHPLWTSKLDEIKTLDGYDFINLAWKLDPAAPLGAGPYRRYISTFDRALPELRHIHYYSLSKSEIPVSKAADVYRKLSDTNLPTLYGATSPYDDFAELFAQYVHTVLLKKPWAIRIEHDDRILLTFPPCVLTARCAAKRHVLERYLRDDGILPSRPIEEGEVPPNLKLRYLFGGR